MKVLKLEVENNLSSGHFQEQGENMAQEERQGAPQRLRLTEWENKKVSAGHQRLNRRAYRAPALRAGGENELSAREVHLISFFFLLVVLILFLFGKILMRPEQRRSDIPQDILTNDRARLK